MWADAKCSGAAVKCSGSVEVNEYVPILAFVEQKVAWLCHGAVVGLGEPSLGHSSLCPLDVEYQPSKDAAECFSAECRW